MFSNDAVKTRNFAVSQTRCYIAHEFSASDELLYSLLEDHNNDVTQRGTVFFQTICSIQAFSTIRIRKMTRERVSNNVNINAVFNLTNYIWNAIQTSSSNNSRSVYRFFPAEHRVFHYNKRLDRLWFALILFRYCSRDDGAQDRAICRGLITSRFPYLIWFVDILLLLFIIKVVHKVQHKQYRKHIAT